MDLRLQNFRSAYHHLAERVRISLQTRVGDVVSLRSQTDLAMRFLNAAERVHLPFF
jgi:tRNA threonylcarbamoyladenosine modification (KEOPS) complex  Pcc1 subunit